MRRIRRIAVVLAATAASVGSCFAVAQAGSRVSPVAAAGTPHLAANHNSKPSEIVRQLGHCGGVMYAVGQISRIGQGPASYTRHGAFSFSASAPYKVTRWNPDVNGEVNSVAFGPRCTDVYLGGSFSRVGGATAHNIAEVSASTGRVVGSFHGDANGVVQTLAVHGSHLLAGGRFTCIGGSCSDREFASLSIGSGRDDGYARLHIYGRLGNGTAEVYNQQIDHHGSADLVEGNFTHAGGKPRQQAFILWLGKSATVIGWYAPMQFGHCTSSEAFYTRSGAWSPSDGSVYFADTGFHPYNWNRKFPLTGLCDAVVGFPSAHGAQKPWWVEYAGCDSYYAVAVDPSTGDVFAAGHERWADNPRGCNNAGPGAITDPGMVGLDRFGKVYTSSGQGTYQMAKANGDGMLFAAGGLWIASSNRFGSVKCGGVGAHSGICFLPYG